MQRQRNKEGRAAKSAHPRVRGQKSLLDINKANFVDLTKD